MFSKVIQKISLQIALYGLVLFLLEVAIFFQFHSFFLDNIVLTVVMKIFVVFAIAFFTSKLVIRKHLDPIREMQERLELFNLHASHELKTPLSNISISLDLGIKSGDTAYFKEAKQLIRKMSKDIDNMLALTHISAGNIKPRRVRVDKVVNMSIRTLKNTSHTIYCTGLKTLTKECDANLFSHVVRNLLTNAIKYSPKGSTVVVGIYPKYFSIKDEGSGISGDFQGKIFEVFAQESSKNKSIGQGIGLSLVKKICDAHNWKIDIKSAEGVGTDFRIYWN